MSHTDGIIIPPAQSAGKEDSHSRWLPYDKAQCTAIKRVIPQSMQIRETMTTLELEMVNLPALGPGEPSWFCVFEKTLDSAYPILTPAAPVEGPVGVTASTQGFKALRCQPPLAHLLPRIPKV